MIKNSVILSIIVPVFNVQQYIDRCLRSLVNQTLKDIEIIIINDGSTDASLATCERYSKAHHNFYVYTKQNEGQGVARNFGLQKARGEFVCYVDSDDWIESNLCQDMVHILSTTNADFVNFGLDFVTTDGSVVKKICDFGVSELLGKEIFLKALVDDLILSTAWNKVYRRSFLSDNNIVFPRLRANEDIFFSRAVSFHAKKTNFVSKIYYHALVRPGSTSRQMSSEMFFISEKLMEYERVAFFSLVNQGRFEIYFCAHYVKLFSYLLIQAAFRISDPDDYRVCCNFLRKSDFYIFASRSEIRGVLRLKNRIMILLCFFPRILRALTNLMKKMGLGSAVY